jgi:hypothetical protein
MPTLALRAPAATAKDRAAAAQRRKALAKILGTTPPKPAPGPSFGEAVRKYAGIVRSGIGNLSTREGFDD